MSDSTRNLPRLDTNIDNTPVQSGREEKQPTSRDERIGSTEDSNGISDTEGTAPDEKNRGQEGPVKAVKITPPDDDSSSSSDSSSSDSRDSSFLRIPKWLEPVKMYFVDNFSWIPSSWTWSKIKPVIRSALVGWISVVLFVIPKVERMLGSAAFLIIIFAFLLAPSDPFLVTAEREIIFLFLCCLTWAWSCLGIFLANLARRVHVPNATLPQVIDGKYIEAAPSVIFGIFMFFGSAFILWFRSNRGPGPFFVACIFAGLTMDICLTTAVLFPYPFYLIGSSILLPLSIHTALSLLSCLIIFPSTITALFATNLATSMGPVLAMLTGNRKLLATAISSPDFGPLLATVRKDTKGCEGSLVPLANARRLLKGDVIYGRFGPKDFVAFHGMLKRLAGRADGLSVYFSLVDPSREKFPGTAHATPVPTSVGTPRGELSRATSRAPSIAEDTPGNIDQAQPQDNTPISPASITRRRVPLSPTTSIAPSTHRAHGHHKAHSKTHSTTHAHLFLHGSVASHHHHDHQGDRHGHGLHHRLLHSSLTDLKARRAEYAVGTFESQRYMDLESTGIFDPVEYADWNEKIQALLKDSCTPLLEACTLGMSTVKDWVSTSREGRLPELLSSIGLFHVNDGQAQLKTTPVSKLLNLLKVGPHALDQERKKRRERLQRIREVREQVAHALQRFRVEERHAVIEPYRPAFEDGEYDPQRHQHFARSRPPSPQPQTPVAEEVPTRISRQDSNTYEPREDNTTDRDQDDSARRDDLGGEYQIPPARCLFHCFIYQYSLMQITSIILEMLDEILRLEELRAECRLWTPLEHIKTVSWNIWSPAETVDPNTEDDDPDFIQGCGRPSPSPEGTLVHAAEDDMPSKITGPAFPVDPDADLGIPKRRDPDHLPPRNMFEAVMTVSYNFIISLGTGNALFALKGGILSVALTLPSLIKSSAEFAYVNRFVWGIFMGQMAIARFQGDTYFALWARIVSTFFGALVGTVIWYIACGSGPGNPFGLAAVAAVCFPFFFYFRLYWPIPPLRNFMFFVTIILVVGYSYQDTHLGSPGNPGFGWSIAWKRFVLVTCGVSAAFFASFLPPATTIRRYQRSLLATTSSEIGTIYCSILSFANTKHEPEVQEIITSLLAVRSKLGRLTAMRANVGYEISLQGRWPADRYQKIVDLQTALSYSLSHLMSVLEHLEPAWSRAFLKRTRFMDPDFQGDVLAVISMISFALRTGTPLPQITPCPLADRFMLRYHGLSVIHKDSEEDYGLPRRLSIDTIKNEQYLMFSVGIATAFGIVTRLDRLMVAVKEVVGEQYHIHGVGSARTQTAYGLADLSGAHATAGHGGIPMGSRTNTVHFDPPRRV